MLQNKQTAPCKDFMYITFPVMFWCTYVPSCVRMAKRAAWRNVPSETVSSHQDRALDSTVFLLRSFGPTAFLLREDGETADLKVGRLGKVAVLSTDAKDPSSPLVLQVCLGERHTCTCPTFAREREPCKHICWYRRRTVCFSLSVKCCPCSLYSASDFLTSVSYFGNALLSSLT